MVDNITEDEIYCARINFLVKMVRVTYDKAQKAKDQNNTTQYNKHRNKYLEYKNELAELRDKVAV